MITPWPSQIELAEKALAILRKYMIVYLAMEERTGKTLTGILVAEACAVNNVLVVTKKKALDGWLDTLTNFKHTKKYEVINYHSASKVKMKPDLVILDEAHSNISGYPKTSVLWMNIKKLCKDVPIIYMSATPNAQGPMLLFHQFALSSWSPWKAFKNFYSWYKHYAKVDSKGETEKKWIAGRMIETYASMRNEEVFASVEHLFITRTREDLGFEQEPVDKLHFIELNQQTKLAYNLLMKNKVLEFTSADKDYTLITDSPAKLRFALHMLEGGVLKVDETYIVLANCEKISYIKEVWGDQPNVVIMYNYIAEGIKLNQEFTKAKILQGTSFAEGVDLSMYDHLIVYSQDFSTARHTQRRARQANKARQKEIVVHFLLVKGAISEQVYKTVSVNKVNFVDSTFERVEL